MQLVNKIRDILAQMPDIQTVIYDNQFSSNLRVDRSPAPYAILYLLSDWTVDISSGVAKEGAEVQVFFADRAKFDCKGEEKDIIVSQMELLAREFIGRVLAEKTIRVTDDTVKLRSSYGKFDAFVVGVSVMLKIEAKQGTCIDDLIPTPTPNPPQEAPILDAEEPIDNELV